MNNFDYDLILKFLQNITKSEKVVIFLINAPNLKQESIHHDNILETKLIRVCRITISLYSSAVQ